MEDISDPCCTEYTVSEQDLDENLSCSICLTKYCLDCRVTRLRCMHIFHDSCIFPWVRDHNTCPLCRRVVFPDPINIALETEYTPSQSDSDVDDEIMEIEDVSDIEGDRYQIIIRDVSEDEESSDQEMDDSEDEVIFYEVSVDRAEYEVNYLASDDGNVEE